MNYVNPMKNTLVAQFGFETKLTMLISIRIFVNISSAEVVSFVSVENNARHLRFCLSDLSQLSSAAALFGSLPTWLRDITGFSPSAVCDCGWGTEGDGSGRCQHRGELLHQ